MEIVVTGRNVEVPEHFRVHLTDKLSRLERYDHKMLGMEVELFHEPNRRQLKNCQRVEITGRGGCGTVARAEACAQDFYGALDVAISKLESRLRRSHDRRRAGGKRRRASVERYAAHGGTAVLDDLPAVDALDDSDDLDALTPDQLLDIPSQRDAAADDDPGPGRVVRHKAHTADPMTVDEALSRMELVGHDFYLFADADSGEPSVVYRRHGYDYGVIRLASH